MTQQHLTATMSQSHLQDNLDYTLFSWSKQSGLDPIHVAKAEGLYLTDVHNKKYLDFSSQLMNVNIGHNHPHVLGAIRSQMETVTFVFPGMATDIRGKLGAKLAEITPGNLTKTFFTNGGADAVENAIKIARLYTGRQKIITKYRSYHGATYGAFSAGGDPRKLQVDHSQMPGIVHVEDPYCYRCPFGQKPDSCQRECTSHLERIIQFEGPENIAAILMEGESGSSGCIKYPPGYWQDVKAIADRYGILIIVDEVMSGFGRCGQWFGIENYNIPPDMIVMAKGLTSGYIPMGGVIVSEPIATHFDDIPLMCGLTTSAHPLGCAAALACIDVYEQENLLTNAQSMGRYLAAKVSQLRETHPSIGDFRSTGLLGCIELVKNRDTKEPMAPWNANPADMAIMNQVARKIRELGMFTFVRWNWIFIAPPLTIKPSDIDVGLDILSEAISIADTHVYT